MLARKSNFFGTGTIEPYCRFGHEVRFEVRFRFDLYDKVSDAVLLPATGSVNALAGLAELQLVSLLGQWWTGRRAKFASRSLLLDPLY